MDYKPHKGTVRALRANDVNRVACALEQEQEAIKASYVRARIAETERHQAAIAEILLHDVNVRVAEFEAADQNLKAKEHLLKAYYIERLQKYRSRDLLLYFNIAREVGTASTRQELHIRASIGYTLAATALAAGNYVTDPIAKAVSVAVA